MPDVSSLPVPEAPPVLSTPDTRIFDDTDIPSREDDETEAKTDEEIKDVFEIPRTAREICQGHWKRVALQFPDSLLVDAPRVSQLLSHSIQDNAGIHSQQAAVEVPTSQNQAILKPSSQQRVRLFVLADTSYGACCVDEVAAEHSDAEVVVHYGRACLSPTSRLPVIYVFTKRPLSNDAIAHTFQETYKDPNERVILMADLPYQHHIPSVARTLQSLGYTNIFSTSVIHDTQALLPNRTVPPASTAEGLLQDWALFHISEPTPSLLLNLASKLNSISFYPTDSSYTSPQALQATTATHLRRRYGLLTSLSTVPVFGILINTLSVRNYLEILNHVKGVIAAAGKKSYTFVVGKVNAAKLANFSEVGGWVVIGCWESSLFEARDFWKPIITPFELELALKSDSERLWTGQWISDFQNILNVRSNERAQSSLGDAEWISDSSGAGDAKPPQDLDRDGSEEESQPPDFDLRTGRYFSSGRPLAMPSPSNADARPACESAASSLVPRPRAELALVAGQASPAAEFFHNQRSWRGLGSDFNDAQGTESPQDLEGAKVEQGRHGIARGYRTAHESGVR